MTMEGSHSAGSSFEDALSGPRLRPVIEIVEVWGADMGSTFTAEEGQEIDAPRDLCQELLTEWPSLHTAPK